VNAGTLQGPGASEKAQDLLRGENLDPLVRPQSEEVLIAADSVRGARGGDAGLTAEARRPDSALGGRG